MADRAAAILKMLQRTPQDLFLRYSLGMEYLSAGRAEDAVVEFRHCIELDSSYVPAYVEAGKALRSAGKLAEARAMFEAALRQAVQPSQAHVRDYVRQQLESLPQP